MKVDYTAYFTQDMARRIYNDLMEKDRGELPFPEFKLLYKIRKRTESSEPEEVVLEIVPESNDKKGATYFLQYNGVYSDFQILEDNVMVNK
ncbi:MAG TPA: hypothetical protein GXZ20_01125 [Halanaerobiaceae bacterium]|jgi:hypothetical protein|nr:hypothetical protein [Halanaerobiaceae bacterium]